MDCYPGVLCRRDLADICLEEIETTFTDCEAIPITLLEDPLCDGFCIPEDEIYYED